MHASTLHDVLEYLRKLTDPARPRELSDADLLERFRLRREEAAFTLLVQRHGPMVYGICRRILGDVHEAEDAFQATFLVLVRNAGAIRKQHSLASWLHGVALRIAHRSRMRSAELANGRRQPAGQSHRPADAGRSPTMSDDPSESVSAKELRSALDEEIERLPDKYRTPLVLCYLADKTHEQAAAELGWPKSSVTARLARARELLQRRLIRRGFTAPAGLLAVLLTEESANAVPPSLLTLSTVRLAVQGLTSESLAATSAAALASGFVKSALAPKLLAMLALLAMLGFAAVGYRMAVPALPSQPEQSTPKSPALGEPRAAKSEPRQPRVDLFGDPLPDEAVARIGSMRMRHGASIQRLVFSPDGKLLVSGANGGIRIWDVATGKLRQRFNFGSTSINCSNIAFRLDGLLVASAGYEKRNVTIRLLDPASGEIRWQKELPETISRDQPVFSHDGKRLAFSPEKTTVRVYDVATGREAVRILVPGNWTPNLAFSPDCKSIALQYDTAAIHLHDAIQGNELRQFQREGAIPSRPVFSPDGRLVASSTVPGVGRETEPTYVVVWDAITGKERCRLRSFFGFVAFSPDSKTLANLCENGEIVLWDMASGKELRRIPIDNLDKCLAFSPDGKVLAASCWGTIRLIDVATGRILPVSGDPSLNLVSHLRFSADGKRLIGRADAYVAWDPYSGREIHRFAPVPAAHNHLPLSPDESLLASADKDGTIHLREARTGKAIGTLKGHKKSIRRMIFSVDGRHLISSSADGTIRVWDVARRRELNELTGGGEDTTHLAVSPDGRWLASASGSQGVLWDLTAAKEKSRFGPASEIAFSPDSRLLAIAGRSGAQILDVSSGDRRTFSTGHQANVVAIAFSADGRMLASGDVDGSLLLWEVVSGRTRHQFVGHENMFFSLAFSPNGRVLAASSFDVPCYVWDVTGTMKRPRRPLTGDELRRCWTALGSDDAAAAFQAMRCLAADPEQALPLLREHLKPVPPPDVKHVRQLVDMLDSDDFSTRRKANEELEKQADAAASALRQVLANEKPSLEVRRRLQRILDAIESKPETLGAVRAVEVLEWIATPDAVSLVGELASGAAYARLTREASEAKRRLSR